MVTFPGEQSPWKQVSNPLACRFSKNIATTGPIMFLAKLLVVPNNFISGLKEKYFKMFLKQFTLWLKPIKIR